MTQNEYLKIVHTMHQNGQIKNEDLGPLIGEAIRPTTINIDGNSDVYHVAQISSQEDIQGDTPIYTRTIAPGKNNKQRLTWALDDAKYGLKHGLHNTITVNPQPVPHENKNGDLIIPRGWSTKKNKLC